MWNRVAGSLAVLLLTTSPVWAQATGGQPVRVTNAGGTDVFHDAVLTASNPNLRGGPLGMCRASAAPPTAVSASDDAVMQWCNLQGATMVVPAPAPNLARVEAQIEAADGAQTNQAIVTVGTGVFIVVTQLSVHCSAANSVNTNIVVGFAAATLPARAHTGTAGILLGFDGVPPGGGATIGDGAGVLGVGASGDDLRYTSGAPTGGACSIEATYYTYQ